MLGSVENLIESSANGRNSLFTREPQILSASLKMLAATRGSILTGVDISALQHIENHLKKDETRSGFLSSASAGDEAINNHQSLIIGGGNLNGRRDVGQLVNRALECFDVKDCEDAEKYLDALSLASDFVGDIQIRDKDVIATKSNISKFVELHINKVDCITLLQEASPLV